MNAEDLSDIIDRYDSMITASICSSFSYQKQLDGEFDFMNDEIEKINKRIQKIRKKFDDKVDEITTIYREAQYDYLTSMGCKLMSSGQWEINLNGHRQLVDHCTIKYFYKNAKSGIATIAVDKCTSTYDFEVRSSKIYFKEYDCCY